MLNSLVIVVTFLLFQLNRGFGKDLLQQPIQNDDIQSPFSLIHDILVRNEVIGDVLDDFEPKISLTISWPSSHETVNLGNDIPVSSVHESPVFEFHPFNGPHVTTTIPASSPPNNAENKTYTLALTDPDAKSRSNPVWSEMAHWIVTNLTLIPPSSPDEGIFLLTTPSTLLPYLPPSPPPKTGPHRYVFVLLSSTSETASNLEPPKDTKSGRQHWGYEDERTGVRKWADEMGLTVEGVNFFFAQNEEQ